MALPRSTYTQLQYIGTTTTQYINTGINTTSETGTEAKLSINSASSSSYGLGAIYMNSSSSYKRNHFSMSSSTRNLIYHYNDGSSGDEIQLVSSYTYGTVFTVKVDTVEHKVYYNGTQKGTISDISFDTGLNYWIGVRNSNSSSLQIGGTFSIYSYKLYSSGTLVFDGIPAKRISDSVIGMYDDVSGTFFTNAGSGTFTAGPELYINKVDYNGSVLIDLTSDTVASSDDIVSGKIGHLRSGEQVTGTASGATGTATAAQVLTGYTFSNSSGTGLSGSMANRGTVTSTISTKAQSITIAQGYHSGSGTVSISSTEQAKIIAANIAKDITILGVTGTHEGGATYYEGEVE